jgi:hypothetical protein
VHAKCVRMCCQREGREGAGAFAFYGVVCMREQEQAAVHDRHQVHVAWAQTLSVVWWTGEINSFRVSVSPVRVCFG